MIDSVDVKSFDWFYNDFKELNDILLPDGKYFIEGMPYNNFSELPYDKITLVENDDYTTSTIELDVEIHPTDANPVDVYIDGNQASITKVTPESGKTFINLSRIKPFSSYYKVFYAGIPKYFLKAGNNTNVYSSSTLVTQIGTLPENDYSSEFVSDGGYYLKVTLSTANQTKMGQEFGYVAKDRSSRIVPVGSGESSRPKALITVPTGYSYMYDPYSRLYTERVMWNGKYLNRVDSVTDIYYQTDYTIVTEDTKLYLYTNFVLNNELVTLYYVKSDTYGNTTQQSVKLTPKSTSMLYYNRFFPQVYLNRIELFIFIYRLFDLFFAKYTDTLFAPTSKLYTESRFNDVKKLASKPWWWDYIKDLEDLKLADDSYLIAGISGNLKGGLNVTRAEAVTMLDRFRQYITEAFK